MKLYLFGIGGTGSRVLRSLIMLLASGVKINATEIIPVIIDADKSLGDLDDVNKLLELYTSISDRITFNSNVKSDFFKTKINLEAVKNDILLPLERVDDLTFKDYIGYNELNDNEKAFTSLLFSESNLNASMEVGFKGNPNIGSVVLNQFPDSIKLKELLSTFAQGDRIFIISSIFGGTGASGFPLLAKNLRNLSATVNNSEYVQNAKMGAISVMPYFDVKPSADSEINSDTFISKTKAALKYYYRNVTETNVLYYVGDKIRNQYENCEGGKDQQNDAHIVELISALSIIDFMDIDDKTLEDKRKPTIYKEFGLGKEVDDNNLISFIDLAKATRDRLCMPLTKLMLFYKYISEHEKEGKTQPWATNVFAKFFDSIEYEELKDFMIGERGSYSLLQWYSELFKNKRGFCPYRLEKDEDHLFDFVVGVKSKKMVTLNRNYSIYDSCLNSNVRKLSNDIDTNTKFIELFYVTVEELIEKKLGNLSGLINNK